MLLLTIHTLCDNIEKGMKTEKSVIGGNGYEPFSFTLAPTVQSEVHREAEIIRLPLSLTPCRRGRHSLGWFQRIAADEVIFEKVDNRPSLTGSNQSRTSRIWAMRNDQITEKGALVISFGVFALLLIMIAVLPSIVDWFYRWR